MRNPKEVEKDEYNDFYRKTFNEFLDPLAYIHFTTEVLDLFDFILFYYLLQTSSLILEFTSKIMQGEVEFRSVLFIPGMGPLNNEDVVRPKTKNIRLYVKRVFISDDFDGELVSIAVLTK